VVLYEYIIKPGDRVTFYPVEELLTYKKDGNPIWAEGGKFEAAGTIVPVGMADYPYVTPIYAPYMLQDYHKLAPKFAEVSESIRYTTHIEVNNSEWAWPLCCVSQINPVGTSEILKCVPFFGEDFRTKLFVEEVLPKAPQPTIRYLRIL